MTHPREDTLERFDVRPWPVDPRRYVLNPNPYRRAPVYTPYNSYPAPIFLPAGNGRTYMVNEQPEITYPLWVRFLGWMLGGAGLAACAIGAFAFVTALLG